MAGYSYDRTKVAKYDGPFAWVTDGQAGVWFSLDSYGRVHHVTGELENCEKQLQKIKSAMLQFFQERKYGYSAGEIVVDSLPSAGGRLPMIVYFYFAARPREWALHQQAAIREALEKLVWGWKEPVWR